MDDGRRHPGRVNLDTSWCPRLRMGYAYALVLRRVYGIEVDVDYPLICAVTDPDTGLERHFRVFFDWRFEEVVARERAAAERRGARRLHANLLDPGGSSGSCRPSSSSFAGSRFSGRSR